MANYIEFDQRGYIADLREAIGRSMHIVSKEVYKSLSNNLAQLKVRQVDAKYKSEMAHSLRMASKKSTNRFITSIVAGGDTKPNNSFRLIYYEYGTGVYMRPPTGWSPSDDENWNPLRPRKFGARIYYRNKPWKDLGGNIHYPSYKGNKPKLIPRKNIYGHSIKASYWFRDGLNKGTKNLDRLILQAVKSVPVTSYIKIRDTHVRM